MEAGRRWRLRSGSGIGRGWRGEGYQHDVVLGLWTAKRLVEVYRLGGVLDSFEDIQRGHLKSGGRADAGATESLLLQTISENSSGVSFIKLK